MTAKAAPSMDSRFNVYLRMLKLVLEDAERNLNPSEYRELLAVLGLER